MRNVTLDLRTQGDSVIAVTSSSLIRHESDGRLTLTLNRPDQRNAIDPELRDALAAAVDEAATSAHIQALILTGAGGAFCAGADVERLDELQDPRAYRWVSHRLSTVVEAFERIEKPTIAVVDGVATGAGLALALACDWRIGTPKTRLLFREGQLGMVATHGGCARLVKLVGLARARETMLGGDDLDADAALRLGLLSEIADGEPLEAASRRAARMLARAPLSFAAAKRVLTLAADADTHSAMLAENLAQSGLLQTGDHREALLARRERRSPVFAGR
jgi:enoyl-CoA hydratase/carnithine racemase